MRLGVYLDTRSDDPEEIARAYIDAGYSTAVAPPVSLDQPERIHAIREAFARHDVMLAEVGHRRIVQSNALGWPAPAQPVGGGF